MLDAAYMTLDEAMAHFKVSRKYLENRAGQCCMKFKNQGAEFQMRIPEIITRRCACGRLFECHDVLHERTCPGCEEEMVV